MADGRFSMLRLIRKIWNQERVAVTCCMTIRACSLWEDDVRSTIIFVVALGFVVFVENPRSIAQPILSPPDSGLQERVAYAEAKTKEAAFALDEANKALQAIQSRLENKFDLNPDWIAAAAKLDGAKSTMSDVTKAAGAALASNPDYISAKSHLDDVQAALTKARADGEGSEVTMPLATEKMEDSTKVNEMKSDAAANDPQVKSAKADLASAQSTVDLLHAKFISTLSDDSDWNEANSIVVQKKELWVEAQSKQQAAEQLLSQNESANRQLYNEEMARWSAKQPAPQPQGYGTSSQNQKSNQSR
jgi:hypothetical protein